MYVLDDAGNRGVFEARDEVRLPLPREAGQRVQEGRQPAVRLHADLRGVHPHPGRRLRPQARLPVRDRPVLRAGVGGHRPVPQYFSTTRSMSWLERCAGATQELFFRHIQPSRDAVGAAICVGTSAVYRRAALDAIGGFPLIGHSEDVFTGVLLGREGYGVQYVPVVLSRGRCPDEIGAFLAQQYRWCEGSMALIGDRRFHEDPSLTRHATAQLLGRLPYYISTARHGGAGPAAGAHHGDLLPGQHQRAEHAAPARGGRPVAGRLPGRLAVALAVRGTARPDPLRVRAPLLRAGRRAREGHGVGGHRGRVGAATHGGSPRAAVHGPLPRGHPGAGLRGPAARCDGVRPAPVLPQHRLRAAQRLRLPARRLAGPRGPPALARQANRHARERGAEEAEISTARRVIDLRPARPSGRHAAKPSSERVEVRGP